MDDHTYVYDDPLRVSAGSRHPQFLEDQTHIHYNPLRVSAGSRHLKDTNQDFYTRWPYIDRGSFRDVIKDDFGGKLPSGRPQTSARVRVYSTDAILPADGFLPVDEFRKAWNLEMEYISLLRTSFM
jgi:hypothetical protein